MVNLIAQVLAVGISLAALVISVFSYRKSSQLANAMFHVERNIAFEGKLAEWKAFKFYGINIEDAKNNSVTPEQINYLLLYVNAMVALCLSTEKGIYDHLTYTDYDKRMFAQPQTRCTWQYVRRCISEELRSEIDRYLLDHYGERYEAL